MWKQQKKKDKRKDEISEAIMAEKFSKLMFDTKSEIHRAQKIPSRINAKNETKQKNLYLVLSFLNYRK